MASVALYRRYRPQTFSDVLGQGHVTETLQSQVREGRVAHAYLFSGARGTGKTSTARILAKALNCEKGPTPEPCNTCDTCIAITDGHSLDVIEIDAASHGGVDDVRELRDNAVLAPAIARTKIYIIDEAHMVSNAGWNAFLKTVEEPPEHVIFVFATTEPHKVLPTIQSRCQRFDFRRISSTTIAEHLARVCKEEGIDADEGALHMIARAAEGGARDALSTLDQLASSGSVTAADAARLLGASSGDTLFTFTDYLLDADTGSSVSMIANLVEQGQDLRVFASLVVQHLRGLLLTKQIDDPGELIDATDETRARLQSQAERAPLGKLLHLVRLFNDAMSEMRQQAAPRLSVEIAVVRATMPEVDDTAASAIARIERLERRIGVGESPAAASEPAPARAAEPARAADPPAVKEPPAAKEPAAKAPAKKKVEQEPAAQPVPAPPVSGVDLDTVRRSWALVLEEVRKNSKKLYALIAHGGPQAFEGNVLTITVQADIHGKMVADAKNAEVLAGALMTVLGIAPAVRAAVAPKVADDVPDELDESRPAEVAGDPTDVLKSAFGDDIVEE